MCVAPVWSEGAVGVKVARALAKLLWSGRPWRFGSLRSSNYGLLENDGSIGDGS